MSARAKTLAQVLRATALILLLSLLAAAPGSAQSLQTDLPAQTDKATQTDKPAQAGPPAQPNPAAQPDQQPQANPAAGPGQPAAPSFYDQLDPTLAAARVVIASANSNAQDLDNMRERLLVLRGQASAAAQHAQDALAQAQARDKALGPAPAEGVTEPPELTAHRAELAQAVADAQVPVLRAGDALRQINDLIGRLDTQVWGRVSADLRTLGPTPLSPANWLETASLVQTRLAQLVETVGARLGDPSVQNLLQGRLLHSLALLVLGLAVTFGLRLRLNARIERALARAASPRAVAWLVALRNVNRLLLPAVGAGLLLAALDPAMLRTTSNVRLFSLPPFALAIIASGWLANSLFSPGLPAYRLVSLNETQAARAVRIAWLLGWVLAAHLLIVNHFGDWNMTPAVNATLHFPLTLLGGYGLWRVAKLQRSLRRNIATTEASLPPEQHMSGLARELLGFIERLVWIVAFLAPGLAAVGYFAASQALLYPMILTLGLLGANLVLFDLMMKTGLGLSAARHGGTAPPDSGLGPVIAVALLMVASAAPLALIWGARPSDISSFWLLLAEGGNLGGIRLSAGSVLSFILVFGLCYGITRALQSVLLNSVLPRTRMDAGGKNAVLSGVGYVGFALAILIAISATGIDLSNVAIVAGALSVGIGFGLQNIVSNFVSGIILLVERPIKEGDWIEVGGYSGYVRRISVRSTEVETFERASVILPNSDLVSGTVLNRTHAGMSGRIQVPVSVTYEADPRTVSALLLGIAEEHPLVLEDPAPRVLLMNLGPDSIDFEIRCYLRDINFSLSARSDINFEVVERLREAGIRQWFWQRDVRQVPPVPEAIPQAVIEADDSPRHAQKS